MDNGLCKLKWCKETDENWKTSNLKTSPKKEVLSKYRFSIPIYVYLYRPILDIKSNENIKNIPRVYAMSPY
jgi:hypothetical protein